MKKIFIAVGTIAILGVTMLIACNKKEESVNNPKSSFKAATASLPLSPSNIGNIHNIICDQTLQTILTDSNFHEAFDANKNDTTFNLNQNGKEIILNILSDKLAAYYRSVNIIRTASEIKENLRKIESLNVTIDPELKTLTEDMITLNASEPSISAPEIEQYYSKNALDPARRLNSQDSITILIFKNVLVASRAFWFDNKEEIADTIVHKVATIGSGFFRPMFLDGNTIYNGLRNSPVANADAKGAAVGIATASLNGTLGAAMLAGPEAWTIAVGTAAVEGAAWGSIGNFFGLW